MKVLFFGYRQAGVDCLKHLYRSKAQIVGVVVPPEDKGRDDWSQSVRKLARKLKLTVFAPKKLSEQTFIDKVRRLNPDVIYSCYYSKIIPADILNLAKCGAINFHGGLLPRYRGCLSGVWSIINGERESGVTAHHMRAKADTGNIVACRRVTISSTDTALSLYKKVSRKTLQLFKVIHGDLKKGKRLSSKKQVGRATYYSRVLPFNGLINWSKSSKQIYDFIRAMYFPPFDPARTMLSGVTINVEQARIGKKRTSRSAKVKPGTVLTVRSQKEVVVSTMDGIITLKGLSINGRAKITLKPGMRLG